MECFICTHSRFVICVNITLPHNVISQNLQLEPNKDQHEIIDGHFQNLNFSCIPICRTVKCTRHITPPKWDDPLISHKSQLRYRQDEQQAQHTTHTYMMCKPTYTKLITQDTYIGSTTYTNTCKVQNQTCKGASNF